MTDRTDPIVHGLFGLPTDIEPFAGREPAEIAAFLADAGINAVVRMPADRALVDALRSRSIRCFAEIACFAGSRAWKTRPECRPVTADGRPFGAENGYGGVCVCHEDHVAEKLAAVREMLRAAEWDGLWLDFIRWPGRWELPDPRWETVCFCPTCLARFSTDAGVELPQDASTAAIAAWILADHAESWYRWRADRVADVVRRMRNLLRQERGADAVLGIFTVPLAADDQGHARYRVFGQDPLRLAEYVDVFSPMVYHLMCGREPDWIHAVTAELTRDSGPETWPIVQVCDEPRAMSPSDIQAAIEQGSRDPASGILLFDARSALAPDHWPAITVALRATGTGAADGTEDHGRNRNA